MIDEFQVTEDDEPFLIQQAQVTKKLEEVRKALATPSGVTECLECDEPIGEGRLKAMPSATLCIDCASIKR